MSNRNDIQDGYRNGRVLRDDELPLDEVDYVCPQCGEPYRRHDPATAPCSRCGRCQNCAPGDSGSTDLCYECAG